MFISVKLKLIQSIVASIEEKPKRTKLKLKYEITQCM
jgi:hypothetical protein